MIQLPPDFTDTVPLLPEERKLFFASLQNSPAISIRVNPYKFKNSLQLEKVGWCNQGYYLSERPVFTFDPLFHSGAYYVQEASSMVIGEIVKQIAAENEINISLDLCASPGGKSTHLLSALSASAVLVSNEVISSRVGALYENITKWGNNNSFITSNDPSSFSSLENLFDLILVDAPCSGEGMFRKEAAALTEWSLKNVEQCSIRQKNILSDVIPSLKPGGFLIYSTCTYNEKENEENVNYLLNNFDLELYDPGIGTSGMVNPENKLFRFFPHKIKGEGLFVAVMRKKETDFSPFKIKTQKSKIVNKGFYDYLDLSKKNYSFFTINNSIRFIDEEHYNLLEALKGKLKIIRAGTRLGEIKGGELIPDHELALSLIFNKSSFTSFELSYGDAINYLTKESPAVIPDHKGWGYFTYQHIPLGFFKSVPGRINNYLPKELKIRMKYNDTQRFTIASR